MSNADANQDGSVDVADLVTIRRIIDKVALGEESLTAGFYSTSSSVKAGDTREKAVRLNANRLATAYQADIVLSDGLRLDTLVFGTRVNTTSHVTHVMPNEEGVHLLVYAPDNSDFNVKTGTAFTLTLRAANDFAGGYFSIRNQLIVTADGVVCMPDDISYSVSLEKIYVTSILLEPGELDMIAGNDTTLTVTILPETATVKTLNWLTSDATVATVSDGVVTAIQAGTATITAQATDGSNQEATAIVTIYPDEDAINVPFADQKDAIIYTLSGTRLDRITKTGVYIINGQKRLVKVKR